MTRRRCEFLDSLDARTRNTPSWVARNCPGSIKAGKKKAADGGPQMYQSRATRQCSRRGGGCRTAWRWVEVPAPTARTPSRCTFQDTKAARARATPSYSAKECPWAIRPGKVKGPGGGPAMYISKPVRSCSRRGLGCKVTWRWVKVT